ncbi:hypothetical protein [Thermorudis peleae]|uniref:hypothetical protein n=1 Tax=Thermorudis peleae TaxID=1382356 RepID=UPI00056DC043|nr:hypothetical protein [Thermorudis peleae]
MATTPTPQRTWYYTWETIERLAPEALEFREWFGDELGRRIATDYIRGELATQRRMRALERQAQRSQARYPAIIPVATEEDETWLIPF